MSGAPGLAIVTGAGSGIGKAIATRLRAQGRRVAGIDRAFPEGCYVDDIVHDLTHMESIPALAHTALLQGPVEALVHCAGITAVEGFVDSVPDTWRALIDVNLLAPIALTHALLPAMLRTGCGAIVGITSEAARVGASGQAVYSASKGGLASFLRSLAQEVGRHGITVNAISPGPVRTALSESRADLMDSLARRTPLGRVAAPDDIADATLFLLGPLGKFITGQTLSVSGGLTMLP